MALISFDSRALLIYSQGLGKTKNSSYRELKIVVIEKYLHLLIRSLLEIEKSCAYPIENNTLKTIHLLIHSLLEYMCTTTDCISDENQRNRDLG